MSYISKAERQKCWDSRDHYWACLDKNSDKRELCVKLRELYENSCPAQWVSATTWLNLTKSAVLFHKGICDDYWHYGPLTLGASALPNYLLILCCYFSACFSNFVIYYFIYRASQILCTATDGCRSRPWLACQLPSEASYWSCSQTLTLLFQFSFRVDGHAHRHTFAMRRR